MNILWPLKALSLPLTNICTEVGVKYEAICVSTAAKKYLKFQRFITKTSCRVVTFQVTDNVSHVLISIGWVQV
jgi:hypothetical protein